MLVKSWFKCFILTMWYVNIVDFMAEVFEYTGFILTMWYVNLVTVNNLGSFAF